ncbi:SOS cell division inhibitor [Marinobacter caseinilyticus]|uniref:SOS cell division inhibitor n=1 Tax=Marinobacter caseinilyticus TaxID=2692195 RepID=UPI00140BA8B3|nr:SOS cell division inhibitor [Marinobacter caseinilyticus]
MTDALEQLDTLIDDLRHAIVTENWETLARLDGRVQACIEPVMAEFEAGERSPSVVQERLQQLQTLCDDAEAGARKTKATILQTLKEVTSNRKAAQTYQDVSVRRPK